MRIHFSRNGAIMTNLTLSTILAVVALTVAAAGVISSVPDTGPLAVSVDGIGGLEFTPAGRSVVASVPDLH
ncbi:MAG: hypothetical protein K0Q70_2178 [Rhodospirillales bacterium]|jgi:hypothetical protein|nr:hypothetical protein [Rhodospirillales bacterium]